MSLENKNNPELEKLRHSTAHLMAAALKDLYPESKFGVGPTTENGFYYDVQVDPPLKESDLPLIEARMRKLKKKSLPFERQEVPVEEAQKFMADHGQDFKVELLELLAERGSTSVAKETGDDDAVGVSSKGGVDQVSFYGLGDFMDLCRGPHVENTRDLGAFKLSHISGAYWRGDSERAQLQRIYGLAFHTKEELEKEVWQIEQRKLRDHRLLGKKLEIFSFADEIGSGLPLWLPNGTVLRSELEFLAQERERRYGYLRVSSPALAKADLYYQSGHLPYYKDDMYPAMVLDDGGEYSVRPMNCPHHHHIYLSKPRTYRDLPLRIAEYGDVYRYEASGALSGLMRTRCFCQNDAHLYCRFDQAKDEFVSVMRMHAEYYDLFGISEYYMRLSLPDMENLDKYVDQPDDWNAALTVIREAMDESGYPYIEVEGEAAFYGPKIDFMIRSAIGSEYAISTNQLDFLATKRFGLNYVGADGDKHPVYVIHRSPLGSHERFVAFLLEHYAGAFPVWLAPTQAVIIPVAERHEEYASEIMQKIAGIDVVNATRSIRVEVDNSSERMQKKIRNAQLRKVPYQLIIGDLEAENGTVSVRSRAGENFNGVPLDAFITSVKHQIEARSEEIAGFGDRSD